MDLDAVRTFVAVADAGRFAEAADDLSITQQAVSKRVAALERELGVRLFTRTARGAQLTTDGQAFLPHARELLAAEERAAASVRPGQRALRVDVVGRRIAPGGCCCADFHRAHPGIQLEVVALFDADAAIAAVGSGTDRRVVPGRHRARAAPPRRHRGHPGPRRARPAAHRAAPTSWPPRPRSGPAQLAGHRIWMPGLVSGTEWGAYYDELAAAFGLSIDVTGPEFGSEPLLDTIASTAALATLVGEQTHLVWPAGCDLRRIAVHDPTPVYPHSLIWRSDNPHPALAALRTYLGSRRPRDREAGTWTPRWAQHGR